MSESIQIVLHFPYPASQTTRRYVRRGNGNHPYAEDRWRYRPTLMDGIVQNELFIGTELGIVSGFELSVLRYGHLSCA